MRKMIFTALMFAAITAPVSGQTTTDQIVQATAYTREQLKDLVRKAERKFKLPRRMLHAIVMVESKYQVKAINHANEKRKVLVSSYGITQITDDSARAHCGMSRADLFDAAKAIECGAKILRYQLDRHYQNVNKAVAAYNAGTPCICDGEFYRQRLYVREIKGYDDVVCTARHRNASGKLTTVKLACDADDKGRFFNQDYVDKYHNYLTSN